ncbi:Stk1 family PASTA domain-containing Ser/Thr kinase [Collinsella provencensis]|uniref:Stk1 family PASTA domain-containing Ser/Thr kinase n=1 Tax=Collinsella provencensis TaxID=1937461 RepID=UPI000C83ED0B|nr:Stk1 family PASTA domain-containing Ser/Thr kinase [Collinsella provencensis]
MADGQRVLGGRYLLKDKVGNGGMASVYRAQDQVLDRTVAVKIMLPQYAGDATFAARFKQEAQAAAGLSSPYIVGVYDWGHDGDTYYIVMEYLRGTDLKSGVRSHGALDPKKVAQIGSQICGALSVAHKHEIIHRDIKPQNIMVLPDGNIKVMDFGIARAKNSHLTQDNNVLGTAHYVSPEQTRGQELGATSDIYSLGVVMYECATGRVPFDGDDAISVALKQVNELPVPPSQINPNVDATLERIILKCMEKDPANRFQTADELRAVLNGYATGQSVEVAEPTRVIGVMGGVGAGATETRVMSDSTQVMARPMNSMSNTATRPNIAAAGRTPSSSFYEEPEKSNTGKIVGIVIGVIAVLALAFFLFTKLFGGSGEQVLVPNVVNTPKAEAQQVLEDAGFEVKFEDDVFDETIIAGNVVDQTPDGNKTAEKGSTVTLVVSKGPKEPDQVEVPNITDQSEQDALKMLADAKLQGKKVGEEANDAEPGTVIWQGTNTGTMVDEGTEIEYKISTGPDEQNVPGVLGWSKDDASNELSNAGFKVEYAEDYSNDYAKGRVMKQSPTGTAKKGSTITLTISLGSKDGDKVDVPNVVGKSYRDAVQILSRNFVVKLADGCPEDGEVIEQSHTGKLEAGSTIILTTH